MCVRYPVLVPLTPLSSHCSSLSQTNGAEQGEREREGVSGGGWRTSEGFWDTRRLSSGSANNTLVHEPPKDVIK